MAAMSDVTRLLAAIDQGDSGATAELLPLVYDELRRLARAQMSNERAEHTLQATALVTPAELLDASASIRKPRSGREIQIAC
jgi:ECF sigma factor